MSKPKLTVISTPEGTYDFINDIYEKSVYGKLHKLKMLIGNKKVYKSMDLVKINDIEYEYIKNKIISKEDMIFCNEMWRKYNG